jgi:hypothetical protein
MSPDGEITRTSRIVFKVAVGVYMPLAIAYLAYSVFAGDENGSVIGGIIAVATGIGVLVVHRDKYSGG